MNLISQPETLSKRKILSIERNLGIETPEVDESECEKTDKKAKVERKKRTSK